MLSGISNFINRSIYSPAASNNNLTPSDRRAKDEGNPAAAPNEAGIAGFHVNSSDNNMSTAAAFHTQEQRLFGASADSIHNMQGIDGSSQPCSPVCSSMPDAPGVAQLPYQNSQELFDELKKLTPVSMTTDKEASRIMNRATEIMAKLKENAELTGTTENYLLAYEGRLFIMDGLKMRAGYFIALGEAIGYLAAAVKKLGNEKNNPAIRQCSASLLLNYVSSYSKESTRWQPDEEAVESALTILYELKDWKDTNHTDYQRVSMGLEETFKKHRLPTDRPYPLGLFAKQFIARCEMTLESYSRIPIGKIIHHHV